MFYTLYFYMNQSHGELSKHIIKTYATLLRDDDADFVIQNNILKTISTNSFSISIKEGKEVKYFDEVVEQYHIKCNYQLTVDIISDSSTWEKDLILVINDILNNCSGDAILLQNGEIAMLKREPNNIYIDTDKTDYYPFHILTSPWKAKKLNIQFTL